jgi:D-methionine transport system permease protein
LSNDLVPLLSRGLLETLFMVGASSAAAFAIGLPLGVALSVTAENSILPNRSIYGVMSFAVNMGRSVPFVILMVSIIPLTRMIAGTSIGTGASIVPLTLSAVPFVGRIVESSLREIDEGVVEAALSMGASPLEIIYKVLLPEALPSRISGLTLTVVNLIGYSAMAGAIGGGGLGDIAIRYGYQRFMRDVMAATVVILVLMVQLFQLAGDKLSDSMRHDRKSQENP